LSLREVLDRFEELTRDPRRPVPLDLLVDMTELGTLPSTADTISVSETILSRQESLAFRNCALIIKGADMVIRTDIFLILSGSAFEKMAQFDNRAAAEAWLDAQEKGKPAA